MLIPWATVCLTALLLAAAPQPAPPDLKKLGDLAIRLRIPLPPKDAPLVLARGGRFEVTSDDKTGYADVYYPAFLLEKKADGSIVILDGFEQVTLKRAYDEKPNWRPFSLDTVKPTPGGYKTLFYHHDTVVCAVQLTARGEYETARGLLKRFTDARSSVTHEPTNPAGILAEWYAIYLYNRIPLGPREWPSIHTRMQLLYDEFPKANREDRDLFTDLGATLNAKPPKPGSVEALLLDWASRPFDEAWEGLYEGQESDRASAPAWEIILRGFDSVPDLIALLDDKRVTAHASRGVERLGSLADELLCQIAGGPIETHTENQLPQRHTPAQWRKWWEANRGVKERDYFAGAVFVVKGQRITGVDATIARIIAHKYPELLTGLCEDFSRRAASDVFPWGLSDAVVATERLPREQRIKLLVEFAGRGTLANRLIVLGSLAKLDQKECVRLLLPILAKMPRDAAGEYDEYPEVTAAYPVMQVGRVRVWKEYLRIARKADLGLRFEMLDRFSKYDPSATKKNRELRLAFLAAFLDDRTVRDRSINPKKYGKFGAAFWCDRITVRDFAAMRIAEILGLDADPQNDWDEIEWAKLRNAVRRRLADETLPDLGL